MASSTIELSDAGNTFFIVCISIVNRFMFYTATALLILISKEEDTLWPSQSVVSELMVAAHK